MFEHASYSYPSWLLIPLEALLVAAAALWLWRAPRSARRATRSVEARLRHVAARPAPAVLGLVALTVIVHGALVAALGPPVPVVVDEHAYLLAADTYSRGRLTNAPLEPAAAFACQHVLSEPTRQSKYPPAQGAVLGAGQAVGGHPVVGLWLSAALLAALSFWCLSAFVPPFWSLVGALLAFVRLGIGSYWAQSYWGGHVAAIGGLLLLGGAGRWVADSEGRSLLGPTAVGAGAAVLLASRPFEGLCAILGLAMVLGWRLVDGWRPRARSIFGAAGATAAGLALVAWSNRAVTGSPWRLPHTTYTEAIDDRRHFVWNSLDGSMPWPLQALVDGLGKIQTAVFFQLGLALLVGVVVLGLARGQKRLRAGELEALAIVGATLSAHLAARPYFPHYSAPATGAFLLLGVHGLRALGVLRARAARLGAAPAILAFGVCVALWVVQLPAHRPDATSDPARREAIRQHLEGESGRHLVLAEPGDFWSCNGADALEADVLWARSLTPEDDEVLVARFANRRAWRVMRSSEGVARLVPWGPSH